MNTSLRLMAPIPSEAMPQPHEHCEQRARAEHGDESVGEVTPVSARERGFALQQPLRDARDEQRGDEERDGVDPVRGVRSRRRGEDAAEHRADRPADVLDRLEQRVRLGQLTLRHEIRNARIDRRPEEPRRQPRDEREADNARRARSERQRAEDRRAKQVGADHQRPPLQPVEQRPQRQSHDDRRQELDDEHRADPEPGVRAVLDVDRERDRSEQGPDARAER